MNIETLDAETAEAQALLAASDEYMAALYPPDSNHLENSTALKLPGVLFLGAYDQGRLVGCGAVKIKGDDGVYGEIKRVFVIQSHRGKGVSKRIMQCLEEHLEVEGVSRCRLETGIRQPEALGLYGKLGYLERGPFGSYAPDPLSVFMEKRLAI